MKTMVKQPAKTLAKNNQASINFMIDATNICQLLCTYCYFGDKGKRKMNVFKVWQAVQNFLAAQLSTLKEVSFYYMGGEPMLAWDEIQQLNTLAKQSFDLQKIKFSWGMTSNLIALDEQKMKVMISQGAGIHCSIDGPAHIQDKQRPYVNGRGSFADVVKNIPFALNITPNDTARVTVTPDSVYYLMEISEFLLNQGFKVVGLFPAFNMNWTEETLNIWGEQIKQCFERYGRKKISTLIKYHGKKSEFTYCGAGRGLWALDIEGGLYHCHHLTNNRANMIIDAATATPEEITLAIKKSTLPPSDKSINETCQNCPALEFCNGGCWADNYLTNKLSTSPVPIECALRILTAKQIGQHLSPQPQANKAITHNNCEYFCQGCEYCDGFCVTSCDNNQENEQDMKMCGTCYTCQNCYRCEDCEECNTCQNCYTCQGGCDNNCETTCEYRCQSRCEQNCQSCDTRCDGCERCDISCQPCCE